MSNDDQSNLTDHELVERIVSLSINQFQTTYEEDGAQDYNRLYDAIHVLFDVLRARGKESRLALLPLLRHLNPQVRLNAAHELLAVAHDEAYAALQALANDWRAIFRARAGIALERLADGSYKPT